MRAFIVLQLPLARLVLTCGIALAIPIAGCGPTPVRRYEISGSVTHQGKPVEDGTVSFDPLAGPEADAAPRGIGGGFAHIRRGRYDTTASGRGHAGGPHRVTVVARADRAGASSGQPADLASASSLFEPYEFTVDLPARSDRLDIEVPKH